MPSRMKRIEYALNYLQKVMFQVLPYFQHTVHSSFLACKKSSKVALNPLTSSRVPDNVESKHLHQNTVEENQL